MIGLRTLAMMGVLPRSARARTGGWSSEKVRAFGQAARCGGRGGGAGGHATRWRRRRSAPSPRRTGSNVRRPDHRRGPRPDPGRPRCLKKRRRSPRRRPAAFDKAARLAPASLPARVTAQKDPPMPATISRRDYAAMYGPTVGDRVRLADTELWIEVERDIGAERAGWAATARATARRSSSAAAR